MLKVQYKKKKKKKKYQTVGTDPKAYRNLVETEKKSTKVYMTAYFPGLVGISTKQWWR
jgi:hypothetical protein